MQMRPDVQIASVIKALTDVVLPAIDADNSLAQEQAQLCIGLLGLLSQQLPVQFRFDCDELARLVDMSRRMQQQASGGDAIQQAATELGALTDRADAVLAQVQSTPDAVLDMARALREATGVLITRSYEDGDADSRAGISQTVLEASKAQLLRDRAMLLPQGWEPDPDAVPAIETLLESK